MMLAARSTEWIRTVFRGREVLLHFRLHRVRGVRILSGLHRISASLPAIEILSTRQHGEISNGAISVPNSSCSSTCLPVSVLNKKNKRTYGMTFLESTREYSTKPFSCPTAAPWYVPSRNFSSCAALRSYNDNGNDLPEEKQSRRPLKLMDFAERIWPNMFKSIKNFFMLVLIRGYFDEEFTTQGFLAGAEQAMIRVSALISRGRFEELNLLVSREALREIERNYKELDIKQRELLHINPADLFLRFIYEIGIIMDDATNRRFVEITAVMQGYIGLGELKESEDPSPLQELKKNQDNLYVLNYRFIREYTKGTDDDWTINKLNHFLPNELVKRYGPFDR